MKTITPRLLSSVAALLFFAGAPAAFAEELPEIKPVYETLNPTRTKLMEGDELKAALAEMPGWAAKDGHLVRLYSFPTYSDAVAFIVRISHPLEAMDHHPDLRNVYGKVYVAFTTHDQGNQISDLDFKAAKAVEAIAATFPQKK